MEYFIMIAIIALLGWGLSFVVRSANGWMYVVGAALLVLGCYMANSGHFSSSSEQKSYRTSQDEADDTGRPVRSHSFGW